VGLAGGVLNFEDREVQVGGEPRRVLVARPAAPVRIDAHRLERMRTGDFVSRIDMEILHAVGTRGSGVAIVLFDAATSTPDDGWGFDPQLDDEQRLDLGLYLLRSQVSLYRELVRLGASGMVGVGFGSRELAAFQRGTVRIVTDLANELESATPARAAQIEVDLWLIEHAATWTGLPLDTYVDTKLPEEIARRDRKHEEIVQLLAACGDPDRSDAQA
jgi:hypothetical protein